MTTRRALPILNATTATFECVFPTCGGVCCKGSRPPASEGEIARIADSLDRILPRVRASARPVIERGGWVTKRKKVGRRMLAVQDQYCVFFNEGCVLHVMGGEEGDTTKYKPATCTTFPLDRNAKDEWYVRQWGYDGEIWDLFCIDPNASTKMAVDSLSVEIDLAERMDEGLERWREG